jgi:hypothetical protein
MEETGHDWDSESEAASPSPSLGSQASVITSNGTKKTINRGRWTKEEVSWTLFYGLEKHWNTNFVFSG